MRHWRRTARINIKALVILVVTIGVLAGVAVVGYVVRKRVQAATALEKGQAAFAAEDWETAAQQLRRYLESHPDDVAIRERYAEANLAVRPQSADRMRSAVKAYRAVFETKPGDEVLSHKLGRLYLQMGNPVEAAYVWRQRLAVAPDDGRAALGLGRALTVQRKFDQAVEVLQELVGRQPDQVKAFGLLSSLALEQGTATGATDAMRWLMDGVEKNPASATAKAQRARGYRIFAKDIASARKDLEDADTLDRQDPATLLVLAEEWLALGELDRAQAELDQLADVSDEILDRFDLDRDTMLLRRFTLAGRVAMRKEDAAGGVALADAAVEDLRDSLRRFSVFPLAFDLYVVGGALDKAKTLVKEYEAEVESIGGAPEEAHNQLAMLRASLASAEGDHRAVIALLRSVVSRYPNLTAAWRLLAHAYAAVDEPRLSARAQEAYAALSPTDTEALVKTARDFRGRDWAKVIEFAAAAAQAAPDAMEPKLLQMEAHLATKAHLTTAEGADLRQQLESLKQSHPKSAGVRVLLAAILSGLGQVDAAVSELSEAAADSDDPLLASLQLAQIHARHNEPDKALQACKDAVARHSEVATPYIALAEMHSRFGQADAAGEVLEESLRKLDGSQHVRAAQALAQHLLIHGPRDEGIRWLEKLAAAEPEVIGHRVALLRLPEVGQDLARAQQLVDEIKAIEGEDGQQWRLEQAKHWLRGGERTAHEQEIVRLLTACIESDTTWADPVLVLGIAYEMFGKGMQAEETYRRFLDRHPQTVAIADRLLGLLERDGRFAEAADLMEHLPTAAALSAHRLNVDVGLGAYDEAIEEARRQVAANPQDVERRVLLARLLYGHAKDVAEALRVLDEAAAIDPDSLTLLTTRAEILHGAGRDSEARALLDAVVSARKDATSHLLRGRFFETAGQPALAEEDYVQLTQFQDSAPAGYSVLGSFYARTDRREQAITTWEAGLKVAPDDAQLQRLLMKGLLSSPSEAAQARGQAMLTELLVQRPEDAELLLLRAGVLLAEETPEATEQALRTLRRIVEADPRNVMAQLQLILLARRSGDFVEASQLATKALAMSPNSVPLLMAQAGLQAALHNADGARTAASRAIELAPEHLPAHTFLAELAMRQGNMREAERLVHQAEALSPTDETIQLLRAAILRASDRLDEAIASLRTYCESEAGKTSVPARVALLDLCILKPDFAAAAQVLGEVESLAPDAPVAVISAFRLLAAQGKTDELVARLEEYQKQDAPDAQALVMGASLLSDSGDSRYLTDARAVFEKVTATQPNSLSAYLGLARVAYQLKDMHGAADAYRDVLRIAPYHRQGLNDLAWILSEELEQPATAMEFVDRGVLRYPADPHLLDTRGVILWRLNRLPEAREAFEKCLAQADGIPATQAKALLHLGRVLAAQGEPEACRQRLAEATEIDEKHKVLSPGDRAVIQELLNKG